MTADRIAELAAKGDIDEIFYDGRWYAVTGYSEGENTLYLEQMTADHGRYGEELAVTPEELTEAKLYTLKEITE